MTVTAIRSRSADRRRFSIGSTALRVDSRTRGRGRTAHTTVSVSGDIDTVNAAEFAATVRDAACGCSGLVLDLTEVDFMAVDGMSALHAINAQVLRGGVEWCVVASPAVARAIGESGAGPRDGRPGARPAGCATNARGDDAGSDQLGRRVALLRRRVRGEYP